MVSGTGVSEPFQKSLGRAPEKHLTLADVPVGRKVLILALPDRTAFGRRLMEIGLLPGSEAVVTGRAPLRDPIQICVLGSLIAIRKAEALTIYVSPLSDDH